MPSPSLREIVHPLALYERSPLPDSQNALSAWREAGAAIVNAAELDALTGYGFACGCEEQGCGTCHPPAPVEFVARAGELLTANREALERLGRVLEIGQMQLVVSPPNLEHGLPVDVVRNTARLLSVRAQRFAMLGDWPNAVAANLQVLKLGAMYGDSEGTMVNWLVALAVQAMAIWQLSELVDRDLAPDLKGQIAQSLPLILGRESGARTMRSEFTNRVLPSIQLFDELTGEEALQKVLETRYAEAANVDPTPDFPWDSRLWSRDMQTTIPMLLGDHPRLWDALETVRGISVEYAWAVAEWLDDCETLKTTRAEQKAWGARRVEFTKAFPPQCFGIFGAIDDVDHPGKLKPITARQFAEARIALRSITNPLGLLLSNDNQPIVGPFALTLNSERVAREAKIRHAVAGY